ncbi:uncharacterized protein [Euwallacea fornicatus]|uniref:uncharacterized protein n=1 Tax=Euwallacea fornicatus TaxID=995702 RepID=UPI00338DE80E
MRVGRSRESELIDLRKLAAAAFDLCEECSLNNKENMSVPQGAFAAKKVRRNNEKYENEFYGEKMNASNYNSKYMNSIWGMYNRFSVHNLKKMMDKNGQPHQANVGQAVKGLVASSNLSVSMERLSYLPM